MNTETFPLPPPVTHPTQEEDSILHLRLIRSRRVGPATYWRLLEEHGSVAAALEALPRIAQQAGVADYRPCPEQVARAELAAGRSAGARLLVHGTPDYPRLLAALTDAPPVLWALGDLSLLERRMVALVGARNASSLGLRMARRLSSGLTGAGFITVSGLARGIDAAVHEAALSPAAGGAGAVPSGTVAVQAGGIDVIYPAEHAALAAQIAAAGLRLSEQPPGTTPQARHFPQRNRIISGLCEAVVVVEAAPGSGSLITARAALDQGREVLAVPGHPVDARAAGCNALIRDGATLVRSTEDVIAALAVLAPPTARRVEAAPGNSPAVAQVAAPVAAPPPPLPETRRAPPPPLAPRPDLRAIAALHRRILDRLSAAPLAEDQLIRDLDSTPSRLAPELLALELEGRIERAPGGLLSRLN